MKKFIYYLYIPLVMTSSVAFADNSVRIKELDVELKTKAETIQKYQAEISQFTQEALMLVGAKNELEAQDKAQDKKETEKKEK